MKKTWIMIAMLAAFSCACDDDNKDDSCVNGTRICNGSGVRAECVDGAYVDIPCSAGSICDNGACKQVGDNCSNAMLAVPGIDGRSISYCVNGRMVTDPCPDGFTVMNGSHGAYCQAPANPAVVDTSLCTSNGAQRCSAMGVHQVCNGTKWVDQPCTTNKDEASAWKCEAGECVHYTVCYEGQVSCDGTTVLKCAKGAKENLWKKDVDCAADGKVCKAGKCVAGSSSSSERYQDCDEFGCQVQGGKACSAICQEEEGTSKCYVDTEAMEFGCGDMPGGDNPSGSGYEDCSDKDCKMSDGSKVKCGDACVEMAGAGNKAWCDAQGNVACSPTEPGSSPSGSSDDTIYDCSDEQYQGKTLTEAFCDSAKPVAICVPCNEENLWCIDKATADKVIGQSGSAVGLETGCEGGSSPSTGYEDCSAEDCEMTDGSKVKCGDACVSMAGAGNKAWCDAQGNVVCSPTEPTDEPSGSGEYSVCTEDCKLQSGGTCIEHCKSEDPSSTCILDPEGYIECDRSCTASDAGQSAPICVTESGVGYALSEVCTAVGSSYYYTLNYDDLKKCSRGCNTAGTNCK